MNTKIRFLGIVICLSGLSACMSTGPQRYSSYGTYTTQERYYYPQGEGYYQYYDYEGENQAYNQPEKKQVVVPETYHVGSYHSPTSHKDRDQRWVNRQNPRNYTIEVADDKNPAHVANKLHKAPKSARAAEIKYHRGSSTYYKGLYGSYPSYDAAKQALDNLPPEVKSGANIKAWGSVQGSQY